MLPNLKERGLLFTDLVRFEISDEALGRPARIYLRPLLSIETEVADEAASRFARRYVTGGFYVPSEYPTFPDELVEEPLPLTVAGERVTIDTTTAIYLHRYAAMQRPMYGDAPPEDQDLYDVDRLLLACFSDDAFWTEIKRVAGEVWERGREPEAWTRRRPKAVQGLEGDGKVATTPEAVAA